MEFLDPFPKDFHHLHPRKTNPLENDGKFIDMDLRLLISNVFHLINKVSISFFNHDFLIDKGKWVLLYYINCTLLFYRLTTYQMHADHAS